MGIFNEVLSNSKNDILWAIKGDNLIINGTGEMKNFSRSEDIPWHDKRNSIRKAVVTEGITHVGDSAFKDCIRLSTIKIPVSVKKIGLQAFSDCDSLTEIKLPDSLTEINAWAFDRCMSLRTITIPDSNRRFGFWFLRELDEHNNSFRHHVHWRGGFQWLRRSSKNLLS